MCEVARKIQDSVQGLVALLEEELCLLQQTLPGPPGPSTPDCGADASTPPPLQASLRAALADRLRGMAAIQWLVPPLLSPRTDVEGAWGEGKAMGNGPPTSPFTWV